MVSAPHGRRLVELSNTDLTEEGRNEILENTILKVPTDIRATLHNLSNGVLSPLSSFMNQEDYLSVLNSMRLANGIPWTIPLILRAPENFAARGSEEITLVDETNADPLGILEFEDSYRIENKEFAAKVYGTTDVAHPGVARAYRSSEKVVAGKVKKVFEQKHPGFDDYALTPKETRALFDERNWERILAFQTRNAPHIGHEYVQKTGLALADGIFINPVIGKKKAGDFKDEVILSTYRALVSGYYPKDSVVLGILYYEMQYAGPKEAIMHAIMRKNFGCTHIAIGRDHAGVGSYYGPYAAHDIFREFPDLGIEALLLREFYYCKKCEGIANEKICPHSETERLNFSGTKLRKMFLSGEVPPKEFMRPEVSNVIRGFDSPFVEDEPLAVVPPRTSASSVASELKRTK
ncbi:MAG: sulfate adenylyltransferase [Nitrososphaerota archaeon]|nr:sulfate adenylyltransferase [Nitrososphaerota archaeon]MDG6923047.1 sulfate adenylyltransferase [Nitrososphaerota archaeon]